MDALATTTNRFVDLILLVNLPINLINRDDMNRPKTASIGNALRLTPSETIFKLGLRRGTRHGKNLIRTKWLPGLILEAVFGSVKADPSPAEMAIYEAVRDAVYDNSDKKEKDKEKAKKASEAKARRDAEKKAKKAAKNGGVVEDAPVAPQEEEASTESPVQTGGLLLVTREEVDLLIAETGPLLRAGSTDKAAYKAAVQRAFSGARRTDQALVRSLFGRMATNSKEMDEHRDGALQIGWPFSVERVRIASDYFGAQDDLLQHFAPGSQGSSFLGDRAYANGCTIAVHLQVNVDLLVTNARFESLEQALKTHAAVIEDILLDVVETATYRPFANAAAQGTFRTSPRASLAVLRISREGCLYDMAPAFELPVVPEDGAPPSVVAAKRLLSYLERADKGFEMTPPETVVFSIDPQVPGITSRADFIQAATTMIRKVLV